MFYVISEGASYQHWTTTGPQSGTAGISDSQKCRRLQPIRQHSGQNWTGTFTASLTDWWRWDTVFCKLPAIFFMYGNQPNFF